MVENPNRGIMLMVAATILFSLSDTLAKYLTGALPAVEIGWIRYVVFVLLALSPLARPGHASLRARRPWLQVARGLAMAGSALFFILGLSSLPMAEAATISFASPLLITVLAVLFLGETVGLRGWLAVLAGFAGVLVVMRPGTGSFHFGAIYVIASALLWSVAIIVTRRMSGTERPTATLLWTAGTGLIVLSALLPFAFVPPGLHQLAIAAVLGVVASAGQWLAILAYRHAGASVLAPLSYGQLIWSSSLGFLVFGTMPDLWTAVGAVFIIGSGLYTIHRVRGRAAPLPAHAATPASS